MMKNRITKKKLFIINEQFLSNRYKVMKKGPVFNDIKKNFTSRDSLGIEGATASIQGELCPVVNTVTPRAFYWIFMVWNYYDFHLNYNGKKDNYDDFDKPFLKKNDYYFVLSNLMNPDSDQVNLVGKDKTSQDMNDNPQGPYPYNKDYFVTRFGGMQYYNAGCLTLGFITDTNQDGTVSYKLPRLTEELGKPMAQAFERVIKDTDYYKNYRLKNTLVPRSALEEFGKIVSLDLKHFDECKRLLKDALFTPKSNRNWTNENLILSKDYLIMLYKKYGVTEVNTSSMRNILFDYFSPRGDQKEYDNGLQEIIVNWETVIGRQYFTIALELVWKYMLEQLLTKPMGLDEWISDCIKNAKWSIPISKNLNSIISECNYSFEKREEMIAQGARSSNRTDNNIETSIRILLSLYNRFKDREDIKSNYLEYGEEVSIQSLIELVDSFGDKPIIEFIAYIMKNWIVYKHEATAFEKMLYGRDGYFIENVDGVYVYQKEMYPDFQGIRLIQLMQVMKDLDMFED